MRVVFLCSTLIVRVVFPCSTPTLHANYTNNDVKKLLGATVHAHGRTMWSFSRIQGILEHEYTNFNERKCLESYRVPKVIFAQLCYLINDLLCAVTRLRNPVPVHVVVAMLLKRLGKGLDYREIGDKFGGSSTACQKVNEAMLLLRGKNAH